MFVVIDGDDEVAGKQPTTKVVMTMVMIMIAVTEEEECKDDDVMTVVTDNDAQEDGHTYGSEDG